MLKIENLKVNYGGIEAYGGVINFDNSIVMKKLGTTSLKLELDSLKDFFFVQPF